MIAKMFAWITFRLSKSSSPGSFDQTLFKVNPSLYVH